MKEEIKHFFISDEVILHLMTERKQDGTLWLEFEKDLTDTTTNLCYTDFRGGLNTYLMPQVQVKDNKLLRVFIEDTEEDLSPTSKKRK